MSIAQSPSVTPVGSTAATAVTAGVTTAATGNTIRIGCVYNSGSFVSVTDNKGNTYTDEVAEVNDAPGGFAGRVVKCDNAVGGAGHTFTLTAGLPSIFPDVTIGAPASTPGDTHPVGLSDVASPYQSSSTGTLAQAAERAITWIFTNTGGTANHVLGGSFASGDRDGQVTDGTQFWTGAKGSKVVAATTALQSSWTEASGTNRSLNFIVTLKEAAAVAGTLSSATPSGTLGTSTTATLGATTDQASGTFYGVVDTSGNISGITAAQVKAGQNNASAAAIAASNTAVSTTSPSTGVTGLTAATAYSYAVVQNNAGGDSNVLTGTFTTAAAASSAMKMLLLGVG
jgi:hypothetical protein